MSTRVVQAELRRFLSSSLPEVPCLKGNWGVGKTFMWNQVLLDAERHRAIALERYAYVSLFGINSLEQLKFAIFENSVRTGDIGIEPSLVTFEANAAAVSKSLARKSLRYLQLVPGVKDLGTALPSLSFLTVRKQIVCIDDVERKGSRLSVRDILGLVSHLKDQRGCKVLLILNEDALSKKDKKHFGKYHEKSIDAALTFAPTPRDCVDIALREHSPVRDQLSLDCVALGIANIRVIKKAERFLGQLEPLLRTFSQDLLRQAIQTVAVCTWSEFGEGGPTIEFIRSKRHKIAVGVSDADTLSEEEQQWNLLLERVGFTRFDEFDQAMLKGIEAGYFDMDLIAKYADEAGKRLKVAKSQNSLEDAWGLYHSSFADNETEVVEAIFNACTQHAEALTPLNLGSAMRLMKNLGHEEKARELLEYYMSNRNESKSFFNLEEYPFASDITDPDLIAAFTTKYESFKDMRDPSEVLLSVSRGSWQPDDTLLLSKLTIDDFYRLFKSQTDKGQLSRLVATSLQFRASNPEISDRATEALKRIASESSLNRERVKKFGIVI